MAISYLRANANDDRHKVLRKESDSMLGVDWYSLYL